MMSPSSLRSNFANGLVALCLLAGVGRAAVSVEVIPAAAPNFYGSPSFGAWSSNAITALYTGVSSFGTPGTPGFYQAIPSGSTIPSNLNIVTNFPSWNGSADPVGTYGAAFANEYGNRIHWGLRIIGTGGETVTLAGLNFSLGSTDGVLAYSDSFTAADSYNSYRVGVLYGADGVLGGIDDTFITSGSASQVVNAILYVGAGNAYEALTTDPGATNQDRIDIVAVNIGNANGIAGFTGSYTLGASTVGASLNVASVPEPGTVFAGVGALLSLAAFRFRGRKSQS